MNGSPFLFADKPAGVTTHSSLNEADRKRALPPRPDGFVEHLAERAGIALHVAHRLDRETTGALCFAKDPKAAAALQELFAGREVSKLYLFLTDKASHRDEFSAESFIERRGNRFVSIPSSETHPANAKTEFRKLTSLNGLHLWEARPLSGKPHQIRLHAESAGMPILGDEAHGGSRFPALCLHSAEISFEFEGAEFRHSSPPPRWFADLSLASDPLLCKWLSAIERRERLDRTLRGSGIPSLIADRSTVRLIHSEGDPLRAEKLGDVYSLSWFDDTLPVDRERASLERLVSLLDWRQWYLQVRGNRGRAPNEEIVLLGPSEPPQRWSAEENGVRFEFRRDSGLSPGLFLDQRRNRNWVRENARGAKVLNLFCYTAGFSVCAALGGAEKVVSVDVSKNFLEWGKANFALNGLATESHEFRAIDSREYLAWAKKKGLKFDLVICDPPSFGRSKAGVFRIEKDFESLLEALLDVTESEGRVLFASNYEAWSADEFEERALHWARSKRRPVRLLPTPSPDWDFELPRELKNMKSFFILPST